MKKIIPLLLLLCTCYGAKATHLMGGEITVTHLSGSDYEIRLTHYRDTQGVQLSSTAEISIGAFDSAANAYLGYYLNTIVPLNPTYTIPLLPSFPYGVEVGVYIDTVILAPGKYRVINKECCRNGAIINMTAPLTENLGLYTEFTVPDSTSVLNNTSPDFLLMPVTYFPSNAPINYNPLPIDIDNDSLAWGLNIPIDDIGYNFGHPIGGFIPPFADSTGPFTMNPVTGEITWTPIIAGNFVQSFEVNEYRNGVQIGTIIRDYQYIVVDPPSNNQEQPEAIVTNPDVEYDLQNDYYYMEYTPGDLLSFDITGTDADPNTTLTMESSSEIFLLNNPATFSTQYVGQDIQGTMEWTPPMGYNKDVLVVFRLRDGLWTKDFTLRLEAAEPNSITKVSDVMSDVKVYPNPTEDAFIVSFTNKEASTAQIEIHNYLGQKVDDLFEGNLPKGQWSMQYTDKLPTGLYYISIQAEGEKAMTLPLLVK